MDEIYFGKQMKFITVVSNLDTGEPLWFGQDRKQETLDEFFGTQLSATQRKRVQAACVDMCGRSPTALNHGHLTAASSTISSTFCNTPTKPSMERAEEVVPLQKNKKVVATSPACGIPPQERGVYCANEEGLCCNK